MAINGSVGNETKARAYSQQGHGKERCRSKGRIHTGDFQKTCITGIANSSRYIYRARCQLSPLTWPAATFGLPMTDHWANSKKINDLA